MRGHIKKSRAFTLIELMIVVIIIGILAALAANRYHSYRDKVKAAEAQVWINRIAKAVDELAADTGQWPGHQPAGYVYQGAYNEVWDLNAPRAGLRTNDSSNPFPDWHGPYIAETIPKDPWGNDYFFDTDYRGEDNKWYAVVGSFGPNGYGPNVYDKDNIVLVISTAK